MDELSKLFAKTRCLEIIENTRPGPALDATGDAGSEDGTGDRDLREGTVRDQSRRDRLIGDARLILAPLCGVTDAVFRRICLDRGADMVVSEMISSEGLVRNSLHIRAIRNLDMSAGPLILQIFGADPKMMADAAAILSPLRPRLIDLNFGCPVRKIVSQNGGSAVLKDLHLLGEICRRVVEKSTVPVSAKIRAGWDKPTAASVAEIARTIEDAGVSLITVHARTKAQGFTGKADWALIKTVKDTVNVPVVGNGDVVDPDSYRRMVETTGCDAVMIGRAAIGNPWVFDEIQAAIQNEPYQKPSPQERVEGLLSHVRLAVASYGEPLGIVSTRRIMAAYLKRIPNARDLRSKIMRCDRLVDLEQIFANYLDQDADSPAPASSDAPGDIQPGRAAC